MQARSLLQFEASGPSRFRTTAMHANFGGAIYGGQLLGQAMGAAALTVSGELSCHSQHAYFIGPGTPDRPLDFEVTSLRDGRSALRRVAALQDDQLVFEATCSFAATAIAPTHSPIMPQAPPPEACLDMAEYVAARSHLLPPEIVDRYAHTYPLERRLVDPESVFFRRSDAVQLTWIRMRDDEAYVSDAERRSMIAYLTDAWLSASAFRPHFTVGETVHVRGMSLDHSVWIHRSAPVGDWFLYVAEGPWSGSRRGFGRGQLFHRDGTLVASAAQEGLCLGPISGSSSN